MGVPAPPPATARALVDAALAQVRTLSLAEAAALHADTAVVWLDVREAAELEREGRIAGALHVPRGVLEFWADPTSPWHRPALFASTKGRYVLFCAIGWRSALAAQALQSLGYGQVAHLGGGLQAWREAGLPVD